MSKKKEKQILLGIDLGTSHSAIVSDNGARATIDSVVGYPKDIISVKLIAENYLVGEAALKNRGLLHLFYPLAEGVIQSTNEKNIEAAQILLQTIITIANPDPSFEVCGIIGVPAQVSMYNKEQLMAIAKKYMSMCMVVSEPFMVAYFIDKLQNSLIIDIGAGTIDICAMKGTMPGPADQVTIVKGGNTIDAILEKAICDSFPEVQMNIHIARRIKEAHGFVGDSPEKAIVQLRSAGKLGEYDVTQEVRHACESILPEILENVQELIAGVDPDNVEETLDNIYVAGGGSKIKGLAKAIAEGLKDFGPVNVHTVDSPEFAGCDGALKMARELPPQYWEKIGTLGNLSSPKSK